MGDPIENGVSKEFSSSIHIQKLGYRQLLIQCPETVSYTHLLPVFDLLQSVINLYYKIIGICSKSKNFTLQNL